METIGQVLDRSQQQKTSNDPVEARLLPSQWIDRIFLLMQAKYGHRWSSAYPGSVIEVAKAEWAKTLYGLGATEIQAAMEVVAKKYPEFPPNAQQFRLMCRPRMETQPYKALPIKRASKETVDREMAKIRELLA